MEKKVKKVIAKVISQKGTCNACPDAYNPVVFEIARVY
jgi:uncharacterized repeat protein (TIGR04076 family)